MGKIAVALLRVAVAIAMLLLAATACGPPTGSVDAAEAVQVGAAGQDGGTAPPSVPGTTVVNPTTTETVLLPTGPADAKDKIVENLGYRGLAVDEAMCVFDGLEERFQGPELAYVVGVLAAPELTDEAVAEIVRASQIDLEVSYDAPDRLSELIIVCQPRSPGTDVPAGVDQASG